MDGRFGGATLRGAVLAVLVTVACLAAASAADAQSTGATLTVTSGTVAVVKGSGGAVQPAASGMTLAAGDQIGTVGRSSALVTFFEGTEIELGQETTIILRDIRAASNREVHIVVEDVLGSTVNRIQGFVNPSSSYQVQTPGGRVVALIRGSVVGFTHFDTGGTMVRADCKRACEVFYSQGKVCEGNLFSCGIDAKGAVTDDPGYDGRPLEPEGGRNDSDNDGEGGTLGG